jgi:hypothetical protein
MPTDERISLLFSGGADSTLAAAKLAARYKAVDLVTFKHYATWHISASVKSENKLKAKYPGTEFKHAYGNTSGLFLKLQARLLRDIKDEPFLNLYFCGVCKLAMHAALVGYNLRNGIKAAASGASRLMPMFPDQTPGGITALAERLYAPYGITLESPVFETARSDYEAMDLGLLDRRHLKSEHKASFTKPSDMLIPFKNALLNTQGFCFHIALVDSYLFFARKRYTDEQVSGISGRYYRRLIDEVCRPWIDAAAAEKNK